MRCALLAFVSLAACGDPAKEIVDTTRGLKEQMCACKDRECVDRVSDRLTKWMAHERPGLVGRAESSADYFVDEREQTAGFNECMGRVLVSLAPPRADAGVPLDAPPTDDEAPFPPPAPIDLPRTIRSAREWAKQKRNGALARIEAQYVDAEGMLDPDDGELAVTFGIGPVDDPHRKTGAPVKHPTFSRECFELTLTHGVWTRRDDRSCGSTLKDAVACSPGDIWKKALADDRKDGLTRDSLATFERSVSAPAEWVMRVDDALRKVHVFRVYPDDCPHTVEQTP